MSKIKTAIVEGRSGLGISDTRYLELRDGPTMADILEIAILSGWSMSSSILVSKTRSLSTSKNGSRI